MQNNRIRFDITERSWQALSGRVVSETVRKSQVKKVNIPLNVFTGRNIQQGDEKERSSGNWEIMVLEKGNKEPGL
ncbi:MAG: hypothetical protein IMW93_07225 [Thermoanaerobacteraceae bacterium]|nr:hypothetical protein [Thermoanaerobacteraceae bacterium]